MLSHRSEPLHQVLAQPDYVAGRQLETTETVFVFLSELQTGVREDFTITEKAPNLAFFWLKVPSSNFTFKKLLRHYAKQVFTHFKQQS